jgi:hypothetical protein
VGFVAGMKRPSGQDVASKSLSDLESLVDQIPSIAEGGGQRLQQQQQQHVHPGMSEDGLGEKLDASHQSYLSGYGAGPGSGSGGPNPNYSPPLPGGQPGMYADGYGANPGYGMPGRQQEAQHSKSYTVENLTSSNAYAAGSGMGHHGGYPNVIPGPHYPVPMSAAAVAAAAAAAGGGPANGYIFGGLESSLMQRSYAGMTSHHHPSLHSHHPMNNAYPYNNSYSSSFDAYSAPSPSAGAMHAGTQAGYQGYSAGSPGSSSTPPSYLQQSGSRPPVDLAYDGV